MQSEKANHRIEKDIFNINNWQKSLEYKLRISEKKPNIHKEKDITQFLKEGREI